MKPAVKIILWAALLISLVACASPPTEKVKIGVMAPLTGNAAELGQHVQRGIEIANAHLGDKYQLIYEDDKCVDTKLALTVAQKLSDIDKVRHVIGPLCAPPYQAVTGWFNSKDIDFMHTSGVTPTFIDSAGNYGIPGITTTIHFEDADLAEYMYNTLGIKKAAVFVWDEEWAKEHRNGFVKRFTDLGGEVVFDETFTIDEAQFRVPALKVKESNADGVFVVALNFQTAAIIKQFKEQMVKAKIFSQFEIEDPAFIDPAGAAAEGVSYVYPKVDRSRPEVQRFINEYRSTYGSEPNYYSYIGYDSLKLYDWAIAQCGPSDTACSVSKIRSAKNFSGVSGKMTFNPDGTSSRDFEIKTVKNGEFVQVH